MSNHDRKTYSADDWRWAAKQVATLSSTFHETTAITIFFKKVEYGARSAAYGMTASGVWIFGESGSGKTTALRECERRLNVATDLDSDQPVLYLSLLPSPTMHSIVRDLLLLLKYPFSNSRTFAERASILFDAIRKRRVRVILIDEVQHVVEGNRTAHQTEVRDFFKRLIDATNVCLVLGGLGTAKKLRADDEQLASRLPAEVKLNLNYSHEEGRAFVSALLTSAPLRFDPAAAERVIELIRTREKATARLVARVVEEATKAAALTRSVTVMLVHVEHSISFTFLRAEE